MGIIEVEGWGFAERERARDGVIWLVGACFGRGLVLRERW